MKTNSFKIYIRKARCKDAKTIAANNVAMAWETEKKKLDWRTAFEGTCAVLSRPSLGQYLVAEMDGKVVGQLMVTREWSDWRCADFWWLQSVYVIPSARRVGVFRALYRGLIRRASEAGGVCGIRLYTSKSNFLAQSVYRSLGMREARYILFEKSLENQYKRGQSSSHRRRSPRGCKRGNSRSMLPREKSGGKGESVR